jgi:hypothetical protein
MITAGVSKYFFEFMIQGEYYEVPPWEWKCSNISKGLYLLELFVRLINVPDISKNVLFWTYY